MTTPEDFKVGDTVYYYLHRSPVNGRMTDVYLEGTIISIHKMVRFKPTHNRHSRNIALHHLVRHPPEGAVIR